MKKDIQSIGSKPAGLKGRIAGKIMNVIHAGFYKKIINEIIMPGSAGSSGNTVLDIGCGGGTGVKSFSLHQSVKKVYGIDYSEDMVRLSRRLNRKNISIGKVEILKADAGKIPCKDESFDIATAFDTINFWPDHNRAVKEILRVLKKQGAFFIINACPKPGTKWFDFVKYKNDKEYEAFLSSSGFQDVSCVFEKNTIIVKGVKS